MIRFATNHLDAIIPSAMQPMEHNGRDTMKDNGKDRFLLVASDIHDAESAFEKLAQKANDPRCIAFLYAGDLNVENYFINHALKYRSFTFIQPMGLDRRRGPSTPAIQDPIVHKPHWRPTHIHVAWPPVPLSFKRRPWQRRLRSLHHRPHTRQLPQGRYP